MNAAVYIIYTLQTVETVEYEDDISEIFMLISCCLKQIVLGIVWNYTYYVKCFCLHLITALFHVYST